jgi:hypothetical protein
MIRLTSGIGRNPRITRPFATRQDECANVEAPTSRLAANWTGSAASSSGRSHERAYRKLSTTSNSSLSRSRCVYTT